jgi:probable F420-dependent oxidoreductase
VKFGIAIFPTDYSISMTELAPAVEQAGFESLWVAEHSHIPVSRLTPYPAGGELPRMYMHTMDPFIALTAAALASKTLLVGTGICLLIERDPIHTAKEAASVDLISNGRFLFGIGGGWNREEMADHGTAFETRWKLLRERVEAIKALWTQEEAEYHGDLVNIEKSWFWPKPVQKPHPPIILGGNGPNTLKRVIAYCDGWMPNRGTALQRVDELRQMEVEGGRGHVEVSFYPRATAEDIERAAAAGVERCIFYVSPDGRAPALLKLDELAKLTSTYRSK